MAAVTKFTTTDVFQPTHRPPCWPLCINVCSLENSKWHIPPFAFPLTRMSLKQPLLVYDLRQKAPFAHVYLHRTSTSLIYNLWKYIHSPPPIAHDMPKYTNAHALIQESKLYRNKSDELWSLNTSVHSPSSSG